MKKTFALIMMLLLLAPAVASAAEVKIGGYFEVTGALRENMTLFDADADDTSRTWYENLIVSLEVPVADNITLFASTTVSDRLWGDDTTIPHSVEQISDDVAYAQLVIEGYTINTGRQLNEWGHMLLMDGDGVDRFQVIKPIGESMKVGLNVDKLKELDAANAGEDDDRYGVFFENAMEGLGYGLYVARTTRNGVAAGPDISGNEVDFYLTGKFGSLDTTAELAFQSGDVFEDAAGNNPMALFVTVGTEIAGMNASGTLAYAANGFTAGPYFNPTLLVGTDQTTSYDDFSAPSDDTAMLIAVGADKSLGDAWTVGGKLASWTMADDGDMSATELDLTAEYAINEGATWGVYAAYMMPDGLSAQDDDAFALVQSLVIEF